MRTNIEIDDDLMAEAMRAGPYKTKKDAVEAGLKLLARQAAYREILKWEGKLRWEGDESIDWTALPLEPEAENQAQPHQPVAAESKGSYASSLSPRSAGHDSDRRRARR
jgi:Arc/MetJ family transcription regulator